MSKLLSVLIKKCLNFNYKSIKFKILKQETQDDNTFRNLLEKINKTFDFYASIIVDKFTACAMYLLVNFKDFQAPDWLVIN